MAHEINNPIAVIQGNLDVLRDVLGPRAEPVEHEIRLIHEQVQRIRLIVAKLLQFARPQDYVGYLEPVETGQLPQDCLLLVRHLLTKGDIAIEQHIDSSRRITCNKNELQQVIINLFVNAIQAMPNGGCCASRSRIGTRPTCRSAFAWKSPTRDRGSAPPTWRNCSPFYGQEAGRQRPRLWVSQALVERYGGQITAESELGKGARFTVWLRLEPQGL